MQYEILLYFIIFLYGTVFGSFLNVLIYRLPLKENIATEHSHCMTCGKKIQWYDLIPLVSYIILGGKCRHCKNCGYAKFHGGCVKAACGHKHV